MLYSIGRHVRGTDGSPHTPFRSVAAVAETTGKWWIINYVIIASQVAIMTLLLIVFIVINGSENAWQGCMSLKITFEELEKVDVQEIRALLDEDSNSQEILDG